MKKDLPQAPSSQKETKKDDDGCFIATAVYGTPYGDKLDTLREFRDQKLLTNEAGTQFVNYYYQYSPPVAKFIANKPILKYYIQEFYIDPIV